MTLADLKETARTLFMTGVRAADPGPAVKRALDETPLEPAKDGRMIIIAFGKASCAMMKQALLHVPHGQHIEAIAVPNYENVTSIDGCRMMPAGHPLPDQNGLDAGIAVMELLRSATANDRVLCLISGGGSALLPTPRDGLTLADKIKVNKLLLQGGLDIEQMNRIRQQLSVLKGGGILDLASPAPVRSLIISDVVGDNLEIIASGPTAAVHKTADNIGILKRAGLWQALPETAQKLLENPKHSTTIPTKNKLICSNIQSLNAIAAAAPDWNPRIVKDPLVGDVEDAAQIILSQAHATSYLGRKLIIWGGETTVRIAGNGCGGRNQELAVRVAKRAADLPGRWVFLSGGTDGRDGPTDAAGGVVDAHTLANAVARNIDVDASLSNNDSYRILDAANDLLMTGATGTNVADIQMLFLMSE